MNIWVSIMKTNIKKSLYFERQKENIEKTNNYIVLKL